MKRLLLLAALIPVSCGQIRLGGTVPTSSPVLVHITLLSMPDAVEDTPYTTQTVTVTGGTPPYTCAVTSGSLPTGITETSECVYGGTPTTPATYNFTVTATDAVMATAQQAYTIVISASSTLPADWSSTDIGTGMLAGSCAYSAGVWTVVGSGISFFTADQQHMCYQTVSGLKQIIANVTACPGSNPRCNVGIRASLFAGAANFMCGTGFGAEFAPDSSWRVNDNDATGAEGIGSGSHPWKLLTVNGNIVSCFYGDSSVGPWTQESSQVITFSTSSYIMGLSVWGDTAADSTTATFASVAISTFAPPVSADFGGYRPTWQGYGSTTVGGRGGTIIKVTNLNNSGAGSLRTALTTSGPRIVVFETSGTIPLASPITVTNPFITIAGQTAPSPGILVANFSINFNTHDWVVQHVRFRLGTNNNICDSVMRAGLPPNGTNSFLGALDHNSISWGMSTNFSTIQGAQDIFITDTIIAEGLYQLNQPNTCGGAGAANVLWYGTANSTGAVFRSLFVNTGNRNPWIAAGTKFVGINNVSYNTFGQGAANWPWGHVQIVGGDVTYAAAAPEVVLDSNVYLTGPATAANTPVIRISLGSDQLPAKVYLANNSLDGSIHADQWDSAMVWFGTTNCCGTGHGGAGAANLGNTKVTSPPSWYPAFNITPLTNTGTAIRDYVLAHAGAWPHARDSVDTRLTGNVTGGTGAAFPISTQATVGGYPTIAVNTATFTPVANPNDPGNCGTTSANVVRTKIECQLETLAQGIE